METLNVTTADGITFNLDTFAGTDTAKYSVLVYPAMGVKASYYRDFCASFSELGYNVISADLRGNGSCSIQPKRSVDFGYKELVETDLACFTAAAKKRFPNTKLILLGNSLGGQMSSLYTATHQEEISALILIAVCSVYYKAYPKPFSTWFGTQFFNLVGQIMGYVPGDKLKFAGIEAKTVVSDWAQQARSGLYKPTGSNIDYETALANSQIPVLCYSFAKDQLAPKSAVKHLLDKFKSAPVEHRHITAADMGLEKIGHFTWAKQPKPFARTIDKWISQL